jgi:predicted Zn-dependent peptidase
MFADVELTSLKNGCRVVSSAMPHLQSVATGVWIGAGSRHETKALGGISHFLEHLLFKGTAKRSALAISQAIEGRGGYLNAFTQQESTCYYARAGFDRLKPTFDVLADMVRNAKCEKSDVEKERQVILEEMLMYRDQPHHYVQELLEQAVWPSHPLGRPVIGTEASVGRMTSADIHGYKDRKYVPSAMVIAFSGAIEHTRCVDLVSSWFADMDAGRKPGASRFNASVKQSAGIVMEREIEQAHLALGVRVFGRHHPHRYVLRVLNTILGENMSSRLFQVVREKHGLAYSIHSSTQLFDDTGMLQVAAGLDRRRLGKAFELILRELDRLRCRPVGNGELKRAKDYLIGQLRLGLESSSNQMMWIGDNILSYGRFIDPAETIAAIREVCASDIQSVAADCLQAERMRLAVITPMKETIAGKDAMRALSRF